MAGENQEPLANEEVNEQALFDQAVENEPAAEVQPEPQPESQPRDESGRFASIAPEQERQAPASQQPEHRIPLAEHLSTRERAQRAEAERDQFRQQLEAMQRQQMQPQRQAEQPEEPDPLLDPKGYREFITRDFNERLMAERRENSMQMAKRYYKDEFPDALTAAEAAVKSGDHALMARMQASRDPGETLIEWHREQRTMKEVGSDPNAWFEKKLEERLKDPAQAAKVMELLRGNAAPSAVGGNGNGRPAVSLPPSLTRATSTAPLSSGSPGATDQLSDNALFESTLAQLR